MAIIYKHMNTITVVLFVVQLLEVLMTFLLPESYADLYLPVLHAIDVISQQILSAISQISGGLPISMIGLLNEISV